MILANHQTTYPTLISNNPLTYYTPANYGGVFLSKLSYDNSQRHRQLDQYSCP